MTDMIERVAQLEDEILEAFERVEEIEQGDRFVRRSYFSDITVARAGVLRAQAELTAELVAQRIAAISQQEKN